MHQNRIEGGRQAHRLGEDGGGAWDGHAMQRFAPPVVGRHTQTWNGGGTVDELRALFLESHLRNQRHRPLLDWQAGVEPGRVRWRAQRHCGQSARLSKGFERNKQKPEKSGLGAVQHAPLFGRRFPL